MYKTIHRSPDDDSVWDTRINVEGQDKGDEWWYSEASEASKHFDTIYKFYYINTPFLVGLEI